MGLHRCQFIQYSGVPDGTVTTLTQVLAGIFLLLLLFGMQNSIWIFPSSAGSQSSGSSSVFSGVLIPEEVDAVGENGLGDITMVKVLYRQSWRSFWTSASHLPVSLIFFFKRKNFRSSGYFPHMPDLQDFWIIRCENVKLISRNFAICVQYAMVLFWIDIKVLNLMLPCFQYIIILFFY